KTSISKPKGEKKPVVIDETKGLWPIPEPNEIPTSTSIDLADDTSNTNQVEEKTIVEDKDIEELKNTSVQISDYEKEDSSSEVWSNYILWIFLGILSICLVVLVKRNKGIEKKEKNEN
ncbi:MAG TPA: hypothetical protein VHQ24_14540, partial [Lachnospiraceae bacterium]|nr:hypothetical protein [Lachnospiraceae bacterium]